MAVVTKGPVATAGSIRTLAKSIGTNDPTSAAIDMELTRAMLTEIARTVLLCQIRATVPMRIP